LKIVLLDANVLIALLWPTHVHHDAAHRWFSGSKARWATCPLTELAFVRIVSNPSFSSDALSPSNALALLEQNLQHPLHEFWPDNLPVRAKSLGRIERFEGHRQVNDAYLLALASAKGGRVATFDAGLESMSPKDVVELVKVGDAPRR
jgi:toxin-antitoxin system PIN domain toxin